MKVLKFFALVLITSVIFFSCAKLDKKGFLSDNLIYVPNPFTAVKGRATSSAPMQVDGSTVPFNVKLLALRSKYGKPIDKLEKEYEIAVFTGNITQDDSTLELISKKIGTGMFKPISINPIGGRIEITPASNFIDTGSYIIDVEVSNIAGIKVKNNAVEIKIIDAVTPYDITRQFVATSPLNSEIPPTTQANFTTTITRVPGPNKIILRFLDKNGVAFNPSTGQINARLDFPVFRNYAPFYPEVKTDTSFIYQYPDKTPTFPLYQYTSVISTTGNPAPRQYTSFYRIPAAANDLNVNINPEIGFRLWPVPGEAFVSGTFTITFRMNFAVKK